MIQDGERNGTTREIGFILRPASVLDVKMWSVAEYIVVVTFRVGMVSFKNSASCSSSGECGTKSSHRNT